MIRCYACDTSYAYLGRGPHSGTCPACNSGAVSPAGELTVVKQTRWESPNGLSKVRIRTVDAQSRTFEFTIAARRGQGTLVGVTVDGTCLDPARLENATSLPAPVMTAVEACGITTVETSAQSADR